MPTPDKGTLVGFVRRQVANNRSPASPRPGTMNPGAKSGVNDNINHGGYDFVMSDAACGGKRGDGGRAMVHDNNDTLAINYAGDFVGGTRIDSNANPC